MRLFTTAAFVLWSVSVLAWAQASGPTSSAASVQNGSMASSESSAAKTPTVESLITVEEAFDAADLPGKLSIIQSESNHPSPIMGPLYQMAIDYTTSNLDVLSSEKNLQDLAVTAAHLVGATSYPPAAESVWQLFQLSDTSDVRIAAADALAIAAKGDADVINKMNHWLAAQNLLHSTGGQVDPRVIDGSVRALAALADPSSFQVLFATMEAGYGQPTTNDAKNALRLVKGDRAKQYVQVLKNSRYDVRPVAFSMAMSASDVTAQQKATIASAALEDSLSVTSAPPSDASSVLALRFGAVEALGAFQWTPAAGLIMENFNRAATEFESGSITASDLVLSTDALAAMATHEAAVRLSLYLGLINSMTEKGRPFDRQVTLAVVRGLGKIGDTVAYDNLSAMQYLDYSQSVKEAAARAVRDLTAS